VLLRARIDMADPALAGSKQPYHAVEEMPLGEAARGLKRYEETAREMASAAIRSIVDQLWERGHAAKVAGILASSGRKGGSLESILASHALIHTADGDHFREALAQACSGCKIPVTRLPARELPGEAARALGKRAEQLQALVTAMGRSLGPPWDADCKSATLLAWLRLADRIREPR